jgi:hypothetical protein
MPVDRASNGSGATTILTPTLHPSSPVICRGALPPIRRLAPLPASAPSRSAKSLFDPSKVDELPDEAIESSIRSATRTLPKDIDKDALPLKVLDVPEYLLGDDMRKDRYDWKNRVIIELGNPNYKGAFSSTRERGPEGKWRIAGLELHIYDAGEKNSPAQPEEKVVNPTENLNQTTERTRPPKNNPTSTSNLNEQTKTSTHRGNTLSSTLESLADQRVLSTASASWRPVHLENMTEHNHVPTSWECDSDQQPAPPFHTSTTSAVQWKQNFLNHKASVSSTSFVPLSMSPGAHLPRTVAPIRLFGSTLLPEGAVLSSAHIPATSTFRPPAPPTIKSEPEPEPVLVLPQVPSQATKQSEPADSLPRIAFDLPFCSGSNTVESLSEIARSFLRQYVCSALPFSSLTPERFFGYLDSTEKERISSGYSEDAVMSWQLNDLPSVGVCPQVGNPRAQGHQITEVPRWVGRNLLLRTSYALLRDAPSEALERF